jgi:hypothetical protein
MALQATERELAKDAVQLNDGRLSVFGVPITTNDDDVYITATALRQNLRVFIEDIRAGRK